MKTSCVLARTSGRVGRFLQSQRTLREIRQWRVLDTDRPERFHGWPSAQPDGCRTDRGRHEWASWLLRFQPIQTWGCCAHQRRHYTDPRVGGRAPAAWGVGGAARGRLFQRPCRIKIVGGEHKRQGLMKAGIRDQHRAFFRACCCLTQRGTAEGDYLAHAGRRWFGEAGRSRSQTTRACVHASVSSRSRGRGVELMRLIQPQPFDWNDSRLIRKTSAGGEECI